jgi:hypothetical protein
MVEAVRAAIAVQAAQLPLGVWVAVRNGVPLDELLEGFEAARLHRFFSTRRVVSRFAGEKVLRVWIADYVATAVVRRHID